MANASLVARFNHAHSRGFGSAMIKAANRLVEEVTRRGMLVVVAAGNDFSTLNGPIVGGLAVAQAISVSATGIRPLPAYPQDNAYDVLAYYSAFGAAIDVSAPGGDCGPGTWTIKDGPGCVQEYRLLLTSVAANPTCSAAHNCPVGYARATGTSFATPAVAAAAALVFDVDPSLTPEQVKAILERTAQPLGDRQLYGHGLVDVAAAVREAAR